MTAFGYSTGTLAKSDTSRAVQMLECSTADAVELSALREEELDLVLKFIECKEFCHFRHVSFHAPSRLAHLTEDELIGKLKPVAERGWLIIIHPDIIEDFEKWACFGNLLCIENMDNRKPTGRYVEELAAVFDVLPEASFCFDLAHARQVDGTMALAKNLLQRFSTRLREIHISEVNAESAHICMTESARADFTTLLESLVESVPVILESPVSSSDSLEEELQSVRSILASSTSPDLGQTLP